MLLGKNITAKSNYTHIIGNDITDNSDEIDGYSILLGNNNSVEKGKLNIVLGNFLKIINVRREKEVIIGNYNEDIVGTGEGGIILANGTSDTNRHNALVITNQKIIAKNPIEIKVDIDDNNNDKLVPNIAYLKSHIHLSNNVLYDGSKQVFVNDLVNVIHFNTDIIPNLSKYTYYTDEVTGLELCDVINQTEKSIKFAKIGNIYGIVETYVNSSGETKIRVIYVSDTIEYENVTYQKGWQRNKTVAFACYIDYVIETNDNINGNLFGETEFAFYTKVGENIVISPSGKKYKLTVDDNGVLSTSEVV